MIKKGVFEILCHGSSLRFTSAISGSGSQAPRMGTPKTARRRGLASAGAGPTTLQLFSDNKRISYFQFLIKSAFKKNGQLRDGKRPVLNGHCPFFAGVLDAHVKQL